MILAWVCASGYRGNSLWVWCRASPYEVTSWWKRDSDSGMISARLQRGWLREDWGVKTTEVGEGVWDLDISSWKGVAKMDVGSVAIIGVEGKWIGWDFGMLDANNKLFFFFNKSSNFSTLCVIFNFYISLFVIRWLHTIPNVITMNNKKHSFLACGLQFNHFTRHVVYRYDIVHNEVHRIIDTQA